MTLLVRPALDPGAGPDPELPGDVQVPDGGVGTWLKAGFAVLVAVGAWFLLARRAAARRASEIVAMPRRDARAVARERLDALQQVALNEGPERAHEALAAILDEFVVASLSLGARARTSEELVAELVEADSGRRAALEQILAGCDRTRYGRERPGEAEVGDRIDASRAFVDGMLGV